MRAAALNRSGAVRQSTRGRQHRGRPGCVARQRQRRCSPPNVSWTRAAAFSTSAEAPFCAHGADAIPLPLVAWLPLVNGLAVSFNVNDARPEDTHPDVRCEPEESIMTAV